MIRKYVINMSVLLVLVLTGFGTPVSATELVVYSARKDHLVKPVFDLYEQETGTKITYITDKAPALLQRIKAEGAASPADLLITVDAGNLWHAAQENLFAPVNSAVLKQNIPDHLRSPDSTWFGLSLRTRTIVYSTARVKPSDLSTYEDLANPKWKNRLVLRTSKKVYNQSLVAMLIKAHGEEETMRIVKGWVGNLAAPPFSNDTKVMEAILAGQGDVGIVNSYYFGRLIKKNPNLEIALFWPNQNNGGVHVNVSGAGVLKTSKNKAAAIAFLEWLSSEKAQRLFADANMEYPVNPRVAPHPIVASWGSFQESRINLVNAGENQARAIRLMDKAGYR